MSHNPLISSLLVDESISSLLEQAEGRYWRKAIYKGEEGVDDVDSLARVTYVLSSYALSNSVQAEEASRYYRILRGFPISDEKARFIFNNLLGFSLKDSYIGYYFILSSLALKTKQTISARLLLNSYQESSNQEDEWFERVLFAILQSILFLIRKKDGYSDLRRAISLIDVLKQEQSVFEGKYLNTFSTHEQTKRALELVALYHTSKALVETASYLINGYDYAKGNRRIDATRRQHIDIAQSLLSRDEYLYGLISIISDDLKSLVSNSIWSRTGFQDKIKQLCRKKAESGMLELLPSQIDAFDKRLFDVAANAIILQMPTSAGKTLLAEFNIIVNKSLLSGSKVIYIVPSRALVNQVYHDLSSDLNDLGISIAKTSSVNDIDPTENAFISFDGIDVIVSTPEKIDLLIRRNHSAVADVSLFIIDEAHMINSGERGARLELLIAMLRRERPNAKYMLLSPFLPGDRDSLVEWLGGGNAIEVDWKPSEKIVVGINCKKDTAFVKTLRSPYTAASIPEETISIPLDYSQAASGDKAKILDFCCKYYSETGRAMLILCNGKGSANNTAKKIMGWIEQPQSLPEEVRIVQQYIEDEIGCETIYSQALSRGIAIHHAGIPDDIRLLIEHLIRERHIRIVCATSTVAEGVNFPVSSVYFDTYNRGRGNTMSANDFWNIAGRAGRTMVDEFGRIILPFNTAENELAGKTLLSRSAEELASVLSRMFVERENILRILQNDNWENKISAQYPDSFGPLFQYFIHLLNVSNNEYVPDIEELFKDTYEYTSLSAVDRASFISLCKAIYQSIEAKYSSNTGVLKFADKTGFSVPSVLKIMYQKSQSDIIADIDGWSAERMFDVTNDYNLTEKIRVIGELKETGLGVEDSKKPFNPQVVAKILIAWVKGEKINAISSLHPAFSSLDDADKRISDFVKHLTGITFKSSWGLGALEGIVRGNADEIIDSYIPSYVYYGVDNPKALALRMAGVPRSLAGSLSESLPEDLSNMSLHDIQKHVDSLSDAEWERYKPKDSRLDAKGWKLITSILIKEK